MTRYKLTINISLKYTMWRTIAGLVLYIIGITLVWPPSLLEATIIGLSSAVISPKLMVEESIEPQNN